ncbi:hypothetical protein GWG65_20360 [Bradyrhizobium sp. CSA207]|uniref:hypothetical protein n=1 Tax=Bradyrhizobium sp. CSA207 TaxID=2698826 RepID=UPI0023B0CF7C|nr:hypothetical protein [Bradyrhizobium sp. CSA207]MDE5443759.1 hypothetical protein [Bradyrhizobium sp. CSA207]
MKSNSGLDETPPAASAMGPSLRVMAGATRTKDMIQSSADKRHRKVKGRKFYFVELGGFETAAGCEILLLSLAGDERSVRLQTEASNLSLNRQDC